jgi:low temperature requirement protein LtrA
MTSHGSADLLRNPDDSQRATFLELFFDLAFAFALTGLSKRLIEHVNWSDILRTLVLLLAVWSIWNATVWITDFLNPRQPFIQFIVIATMLGVLVMSVAIPEAFSKHGLVFADAYVAIQIGRGLLLVAALRGSALGGRVVRVLLWFCVSAVPWVAGAFVHGSARAWLWTLAVTVDYTAGLLDYPTPGTSHPGRLRLTIAGEHLTERYQQFLIIALGDSILITGSTFSGEPFEPFQPRMAAFMLAFVTTVLLWRIYIYRAGELLGGAIAVSENPIRLGRAASYTHLVMVTGIIATTVGNELIISHPFGHTQAAWIGILLTGPALFLAGRGLFEYEVFSRVSWSRFIGLAVLGAVAPATSRLPPLGVAVVVDLILIGIAVSDVIGWHQHPRQPRPPSHGQRDRDESTETGR